MVYVSPLKALSNDIQINLQQPLAGITEQLEKAGVAKTSLSISDSARSSRIRQYEDFFNVSGMATPDDLEEFRSCQTGYQGSVTTTNCSLVACSWAWSC